MSSGIVPYSFDSISEKAAGSLLALQDILSRGFETSRTVSATLRSCHVVLFDYEPALSSLRATIATGKDAGDENPSDTFCFRNTISCQPSTMSFLEKHHFIWLLTAASQRCLQQMDAKLWEKLSLSQYKQAECDILGLTYSLVIHSPGEMSLLVKEESIIKQVLRRTIYNLTVQGATGVDLITKSPVNTADWMLDLTLRCWTNTRTGPHGSNMGDWLGAALDNLDDGTFEAIKDFGSVRNESMKDILQSGVPDLHDPNMLPEHQPIYPDRTNVTAMMSLWRENIQYDMQEGQQCQGDAFGSQHSREQMTGDFLIHLRFTGPSHKTLVNRKRAARKKAGTAEALPAGPSTGP